MKPAGGRNDLVNVRRSLWPLAGFFAFRGIGCCFILYYMIHK